MSGLALGPKEATKYTVINTDVISSGDQTRVSAPIEIVQVNRIQNSDGCAEGRDITGPDWQTFVAKFMSELNEAINNRLVRHRLRATRDRWPPRRSRLGP